MFDQTFALADVPKVFILAFLEIALSADNAIVLGIFTSRLPQKLRAKALYIGSMSAFFIRAVALIFLSLIIRYRFVQILGAAYLLFLSARYFWNRKKLVPSLKNPHEKLWKVIVLIEVFDVIFAIDSILAGVAFISSSDPRVFASKMWIVYVGGMIGLLGIRYAGHLFGSIISKFPNMERAAHLMIGWIAIKLVYELFPHPEIFEFFFWGILFILFLFGFMKKKKAHG